MEISSRGIARESLPLCQNRSSTEKFVYRLSTRRLRRPRKRRLQTQYLLLHSPFPVLRDPRVFLKIRLLPCPRLLQLLLRARCRLRYLAVDRRGRDGAHDVHLCRDVHDGGPLYHVRGDGHAHGGGRADRPFRPKPQSVQQ